MRIVGKGVHGGALLCLVVLGAAFPATGAADDAGPAPSDKREARELGDPAGFAPGRDQDRTFRLNGRTISRDTAARRDLVCVEDDSTVTRCYESDVEADRALEENPPKVRGESRSARGKARGAAHCDNNYLSSFEHAGYGGWSLRLYSTGDWYNLTGGYNDTKSAFKGGHRDFHLSEHNDGNGLWYPGNTAACQNNPDIWAAWNDRISSRYRSTVPHY